MANYTRQRVDPTSPICSTSLPSGERVQIVAPPACDLGRYSITIRKPSTRTFGLDELEAGGLFEQTKIARGRTTAADVELNGPDRKSVVEGQMVLGRNVSEGGVEHKNT